MISCAAGSNTVDQPGLALVNKDSSTIVPRSTPSLGQQVAAIPHILKSIISELFALTAPRLFRHVIFSPSDLKQSWPLIAQHDSDEPDGVKWARSFATSCIKEVDSEHWTHTNCRSLYESWRAKSLQPLALEILWIGAAESDLARECPLVLMFRPRSLVIQQLDHRLKPGFRAEDAVGDTETPDFEMSDPGCTIKLLVAMNPQVIAHPLAIPACHADTVIHIEVPPNVQRNFPSRDKRRFNNCRHALANTIARLIASMPEHRYIIDHSQLPKFGDTNYSSSATSFSDLVRDRCSYLDEDEDAGGNGGGDGDGRQSGWSKKLKLRIIGSEDEEDG